MSSMDWWLGGFSVLLAAIIKVTERSQSWSGDVRLRGGFELRCCLALSYLNVLKRFPNDYSISLSKLIQQWNVVALKQRVLFNIK